MQHNMFKWSQRKMPKNFVRVCIWNIVVFSTAALWVNWWTDKTVLAIWIAINLMPRSHQTGSQYVLQNDAERGQTVCERNERCDHCLESFYELNGRFMDGVDGLEREDIPERRDCSKSWGDHPVPKLDGVTTCLKRDGRSTSGIAVLRTY